MSMTGIYKPQPEIYRFPPWLLVTLVLLSVLGQVYLPLYFSIVTLFDLPLLVVIYFGINRRNPSTGLLLGCFVGLFQDALSDQFIGQFGMAKTAIGFLASSLSVRVDTDSATTRAMLIFLFFLLQNFILEGEKILLLNQASQLLSLQTVKQALVNPFLGVLVFSQLDRFRKNS